MAPHHPGLRPHQEEALEAVTAAVGRGERRATVVSACGTGKTHTAAAAAQRLAPQGTVLVAVPTLALLTQTIRRWRQAGRRGPAVGLSSLDQHRSGLTRGEATMVKTADRLAETLKRPGPATVFTTYGSLHHIRAAHHRHALPPWDLLIIDEAHRTCMSPKKGWGAIHDDAAVPAKTRLYLTATPRIWRTPARPDALTRLMEDAPHATMDRQDIYGPTVYRLGLAEAIDRSILADYRVAMPIVRDHELRGILTANPAHSAHHDGLRAAARQLAVLKAVHAHDLRRILVFHNRIDAAHAFADTLPGTAAETAGDLHLPRLWSHAIDSRMRLADRRRLLEDFAAAQDPAVLSNVRVLNEGVDIPATDAVAFAAPRDSVIDAIQAIGRALRQPPGAGKKATLVIPVYLPDAASAHQHLHTSEFARLWSILQALRAHDDTFLDRVARPHTSGPSGSAARPAYYSPPERALELARALGLDVTLPATGSWSEGIAAATGYHRSNGHLDVPADYRDEAGFALGEWIGNQRLRHTAGQLPASHRQALEALGMLWDTPRHDFARMLAHARTYAARHGHLAAPQDAEIGGHPIGTWLGECRRKARAGELEEAREQALREIDPWWNPPFPITWRRTYAAAKAHVEAHGTGHVPNTYTTDEGVPLGQWLSRQRNGFHKLQNEQVQLLLDLHLGPEVHSLYHYDPRDPRSREFFAYLQAAGDYLAREGNLRVPRSHREATLGGGTIELGKWIHKIRKAPEELTEEERAALEALHMVWRPALGRRRQHRAPREQDMGPGEHGTAEPT